MFIVFLKVLEKFEYNINIYNAKSFIKALKFRLDLDELEQKRFEEMEFRKHFHKIDLKIREKNDENLKTLRDMDEINGL